LASSGSAPISGTVQIVGVVCATLIAVPPENSHSDAITAMAMRGLMISLHIEQARKGNLRRSPRDWQ
jgi:hypothetical protein